MIADRYLGYVKSIFIGGSLLAAGYLGLILPGNTAMYISLGLIIAGNGFFKPNISTLLGNIYNRDDLKPLKDNAYNIFYMGINIGAFVCNFVAAFLRNKYGWGYAFGAAGIGMIIGLITFGSNLKHVRGRRCPPGAAEGGHVPVADPALCFCSRPDRRICHQSYTLPGRLFHTTIMGSPASDAFVFACIPVLAFFVSLWVKARGQDKKGIGALLFIFAVSIIFWAIYYQNFTAYTLWGGATYGPYDLHAGGRKRSGLAGNDAKSKYQPPDR